MKQVLQELGSGKTLLADVPEPAAPEGSVRIITRRSLISAGTERMLVQFGRAGWLERARQQPERVGQAIEKARTDGIAATVAAVRSKLEQALPLGYCNVGIVDAGTYAHGFAAGDRVVSTGSHAEVVAVPANLCAHVPPEVSEDSAAFTVIAAVALQAVRLAAPTLGESFVVTGLGLVGLIAVQLLRSNGCRVLGIDPDASRTELARRFGAHTVELGSGEDPLAAADRFTRGQGIDGVIIAAATDSDEPVSQAARMCRKRGRIILAGVTGLHLRRTDFYEKELTFQVSCSYGPGRYDPEYEQGGKDYPPGFVRWTAQRNFAAVLELMASKRLDVEPLVTHRFALLEATRAYDLLAGSQPHLGVLLEYAPRGIGETAVRALHLRPSPPVAASEPVVVVIGAGNYAGRVLIPALARAGAQLLGIASSGGINAARVARKHGFCEATTDASALLDDPRVNTVVIATRHDTHASFVLQALARRKHVFVEKPLALTQAELDQIDSAVQGLPGTEPPVVMVGFNRRFAPHVVRMKELLRATPGPKSIVVTVNAGAVPAAHWTQDALVGGGRLLGEGCHFIDLLRHLADSPIRDWDVSSVAAATAGSDVRDSATVTLKFCDGSLGTLHYLTNGHPSFPKERVEVFSAGRVLQLDNFRHLRAYGWRGFASMSLWRQDKGQNNCVLAFLEAIRQGQSAPIAYDELLEVSRVSVAVAQAARA